MHRISLGNDVFEGENNAYLFEDPPTLVDTGVAVPDTRRQLEAGLDEHGLDFADVERVFLTHYHADHSGLAGAIQQAGGATVYAHALDEPLAANDPAAWEDLFERYRTVFEEWNMPASEREELLAFLEGEEEAYGEPVDIEPFEDGDTFSVGGHELEVLHAPGHTAGLCCFVLDGSEVLTGDAVLPVYTPNVGGADVRVESALAKYLRTLRTVADRTFERAWPGHRDPIDDPAGRVRTIFRHHEERALRVLRVLEERGTADEWTVSADLFGSLENIHILHGPGEANAHLEHLRETGDVRRTDDGWALADGTAERLADVEGDRWPLSGR